MEKCTIGANIKNYRTKNNLTQQQLADSLSVSRPTVASYESGRTEPDIATMEKLAEIFEISVDELLGKTVDKKQLPSLYKIGLIEAVVLNAVLLIRNILFWARNKFFYLQPGPIDEDMKKILEIRMATSQITDIIERIYSPLLTVCIILLISYKIHFNKNYKILDLVKVFVAVMLSQIVLTGVFCIIDTVTTTTDYMYIITLGYFFNLDNIFIIAAFALGYCIYKKYNMSKQQK